ncbi:alpha/beta fold hydrolase [Paraburkholderia sp. BCC1886]|uniref:alpha/beta fold hydrolase n=1 Tax=Paraburkholderia sp. BCC1886 TaxID=2562670 RepID=UPI00118322E0|nr:alpha/beta hydrolase [Paraburkholderia sp. BCC1886]
MLKTIATDRLIIGYDVQGSESGWPVLLLHGFPYDIHAYDEVSASLALAGARVITPYLRGYGPTRFVSPTAIRSGQQAALAADVIALLDALGLARAVLAGYDWGGRAACIVAALYPERATALVSANGYAIQNIAAAIEPRSPAEEHRLWYQYYFHGERGRAGLADNRREFCRLLWSLWSPTWRFDDATYAKSAASFDNPDFVDVVIHSYRHRFGLAAGDPQFEEMERRLATTPSIGVPAITIEGDADGVAQVGAGRGALRRFTGRHENRVVPGVGHNLPQEAPAAFAQAIVDVANWAS